MNNNESLTPHNFDAVIGQGITEEAARDLTKKHLVKLKYEVEVRELEIELEALRRKINDDPRTRKLKELKKRLKEKRTDMRTAQDFYLGAVGTGLCNYLPGKKLSEKLIAINETAKQNEFKK